LHEIAQRNFPGDGSRVAVGGCDSQKPVLQLHENDQSAKRCDYRPVLSTLREEMLCCGAAGSRRYHTRDRRVIGLSAKTRRHNSCGNATKCVALNKSHDFGCFDGVAK
jgi:hypothetical protein